MERGKVICCKHDIDDNVHDRANANPILDTRLFEIKFPISEVMELAANVIDVKQLKTIFPIDVCTAIALDFKFVLLSFRPGT